MVAHGVRRQPVRRSDPGDVAAPGQPAQHVELTWGQPRQGGPGRPGRFGRGCGRVRGAARGDRPHGGDDPRQRGLLAQEPGRARLEGLAGRTGPRVRGEHQGAGPGGVDVAEQGQAAPGQTHVEDHDLRRPPGVSAGQGGPGGRRVVRDADDLRVTVGGEAEREQVGVRPVVVDQQHPQHLRAPPQFSGDQDVLARG
nr:hypothetical protein [Pseudonocardia sp. AL041005-10]